VLQILVTFVARWMLRMGVTIEVNNAHPFDVEAVRYFIFIYD
jgi:hypothetical protein